MSTLPPDLPADELAIGCLALLRALAAQIKTNTPKRMILDRLAVEIRELENLTRGGAKTAENRMRIW
jgi:hypothetical protein